jgi:hypothetical protein
LKEVLSGFILVKGVSCLYGMDITAPTSRVFELGPYILGVSEWAHDPQYNANGKECEGMDEKADAPH